MLDVRRLRLLVALDRHGTIAAAAEELHLTASGISMQLRTLERELRIPLTERRGRRLALTPAGRLLVEHGRDVLDRLRRAELEVGALRRGAVGTYGVAAFPSAARTLVADAWRGLRDAGSGVGLRVRTMEPEDGVAALLAGEVDLALVHGYSNVPRRLPDGVTGEPVATEPVWLALPADDPTWPRGGTSVSPEVDLAAFADRDWVVPQRGLTCREMTDRACGLAGFRPRAVAESADFAAQLALVAAGAGVALVPDLAADPVPSGVRLARPVPAVERNTAAAVRVSAAGDAGLRTVVGALVAAAELRGRTAAPTAERS